MNFWSERQSSHIHPRSQTTSFEKQRGFPFCQLQPFVSPIMSKVMFSSSADFPKI
jgi:hypothetical protein